MTDNAALPASIQQTINELVEVPDHSPLVPITAEDLMQLVIPARQNLLSPWLPAKGLTMIVGPRGIGKTYLAGSVALAVACGGSLLGWQAPAPKRVLYVDGEMPTFTVQERLAAFASGSGFGPTNQNLSYLLADMAGGLPDLSTPRGQEEIADALAPFDLIILDNLSTLLRTGRENDAESWTAMQGFLLGLRRQGKSVLLIHHTNKEGGQRGTSRHEDVLDTVLLLRRPGDHSATDGARFSVTFDKARGFYGPEAELFEARLDPDTNLWLRDGRTDARLEAALELRAAGLSQREIGVKLGTSLSSVNRMLKRADRK